MSSLFTIFIFLLTLSILIIVHEYGHYRMAKWCGVKVLRFSIGFGKPFFTWKVGKDQTEFSLAPLLFGGYVRMLDSREKEIAPQDFGRDFNRKPLIQRALIVFAGPAANFLLAVVFIALTTLFGVQDSVMRLAQPVANSMLAQAGVQDGDKITGIIIGDAKNSESIDFIEDLAIFLYDATSSEKDVRLQITRFNGSAFEAELPLGRLGAQKADRSLLRAIGFNGLWTPPQLKSVTPEGAANRAGLKTGDNIRAINDEVIGNGWELVRAIQKIDPDSASYFTIERDGATFQALLTPDKVEMPVIASLQQADPAYVAGLREGDIVRAIGQQPIINKVQYIELLQADQTQKTIDWIVERQGQTFRIPYIHHLVDTTGRWESRIGVEVSGPESVIVQYGFLKSFAYGWDKTLFISRSILTSIGNMIAGKTKVQDNLSGPIEIASIASQSAQRGLNDYVLFLAKISISLFILNLLPLPVLDGGHLFLYMIEAVRRKPLPDQWIGVLQRIGVFLLLTLMLFVTFNDILKRL